MPIVLVQSAIAEEIRIGHLETADDIGSNWLFFHCEKSGVQMECDIFQTLIFHPPSASDQAKKVKKFLEGDPVNNFKQDFGSICKVAEQMKSALESAQSTGKGFDGRPYNPAEAKSRLPTARAIAAACANPTMESVKAAFAHMLDDESLTCTIHNDHSHSKFVYDKDTDSWMTKEGPTGPCGAMNIGMLQRDKNMSSFWKYTEKRIKLNKTGKGPNGLSCSDFQQDITLNYSWRAQDKYEGCTYIKNSMN
jgi:hypothetical protein